MIFFVPLASIIIIAFILLFAEKEYTDQKNLTAYYKKMVDSQDTLIEAHKKYAASCESYIKLLKEEYDSFKAQKNAWEETANRFAGDSDWYKGLLIQVAEKISITVPALDTFLRSDDTGAIQEDIFVSKIPEAMELFVTQWWRK